MGDANSNKITVPFGIFNALNHKSVPTVDDVKLARYLWKFASAEDKEEKVLRWITLSLSLQKSLDFDVKELLWNTLVDFLLSYELKLYCEKNEKEIEVKSVFTNYFLNELSEQGDDDHVLHLIDVCKCLCFNQKILNEFGVRFQTVTKLIGGWLSLLNRFMSSHEKPEFLDRLLKFITHLLEKVIKTLQDAFIKHAPIYVAKFFMIPAIQVYERLCHRKDLCEETSIILKAIETVFAKVFFTHNKFCSKPYNCDSQLSAAEAGDSFEGMTTKQLHSSTFCFFLKLHLFVFAGDGNAQYCITTYRIYLNSSAQTQTERRASFFLNIKNILQSDDRRSHFDIVMKLFKMSIPSAFHKLHVNADTALQLQNFNVDFARMMMEEGTLNETIESLTILAETDYASVEKNFAIVMRKILQTIKENQRQDINAISDFFKAVFQASFDVRKPGELLTRLIMLVIEEIARNGYNQANQHCIIICGIVGRVLSPFYQTVIIQGAVYDVWKNLQSKARELIPSSQQVTPKDQADSPSEEVSGKKRKRSEANKRSKRIKLDIAHSNILHCLLILLNNVLENVDFCELDSLALFRQKVRILLIELQAMILDLKCCIRGEDGDLLGQYYQLLVLIGHQELATRKYSPTRTETEDFFDVKNLSIWDIETSGVASFCSRYYCKQWQSFKIHKLCFKLQQLELEDVFISKDYERLKEILHENMLLFLAVDTDADSKCHDVVWDQIPEHIDSQAIFNVAFLSLVQSSLPVLLTMSCEDCILELGNLISRFYQTEKKVLDGHESVSSVIHDILRDPILAECSRFHKVFMQVLLQNVKNNIKGSKRNKDVRVLVKFAMSCLIGIDKVDHKAVEGKIVPVFNMQFSEIDEDLQVAMVHALRAVLHLPHHSFSTNQKLTFLIIVLGCLATCPDDYKLHEVGYKAVADVLGDASDQVLLDAFPVAVIFPHFNSRLQRYSMEGQRNIKNLLYKVCSSSSLEYIQNMLVEAASVKGDSLTSVTWLLECCCDVIKRQLGITGCSQFVLVHGEDEKKFVEGTRSHLIIHTNVAKRKAFSDAELSSVSKCIALIRRLIKESKVYLKKLNPADEGEDIKFDLLKYLILSTFYVDVCSNQTKEQQKLFKAISLKTHLLHVLTNLKYEKNIHKFRTKIQLLLIYFEQSLTSKSDKGNQESASFMELGVSWREVVTYLVSAYHAGPVTDDSLEKALLCRLLYCVHFLLPSVSSYLDFTSSSIEILKTCTESENIQSVFAYVGLLVSSYNKHTRNFGLVEAKKEDKLSGLHALFLNDVFLAIPYLIERITSSTLSQSDVSILREAVSTLNAVISTGNLVSENHLGRALASLERIELRNIYLNYTECFTPLFSSFYQLLSSVLSQYQKFVENIVPQIQTTIRKLIGAVLYAGRQSLGKSPDYALECSRMLERINHSIASNCKRQFAYCILFVVADYVSELVKEPVHPTVKTSMDNGMYHLASMCSEEDVEVLNVSVAHEIQPIFQDFYSGYSKYFKYKGWV